MSLIYRTSGPWGTGISEDLTPEQVDNNFWELVQDILEKAPQGVGISNFVVSGNQLTVVLTDHTLLGPYPLPVANLSFRGEWAAVTPYFTNEIITRGGNTYMVLMNHTSALTFDPGANDGLGNDYYGLLLQNPASSLPTGGVVGSFLRKAGITDYAVAWEHAILDDLADVTYSSPAPVNGDVLTYFSGIWRNAPPVRAFNDLSDVTMTTPANGQTLTYSFGQWINVTPTVGADITIQSTPSIEMGQPLAYDGTKFTNTSKVDFPYAKLNVFGDITIDRANGEVQEITINSDCTLSFTGWPLGTPNNQFARLVLLVVNPGTHVLTWPLSPSDGVTPYVRWSGGIIPNNSPNATDIYIFFSFDGGDTVYGNVVGMNYLPHLP
jgi:hypothetical protein